MTNPECDITTAVDGLDGNALHRHREAERLVAWAEQHVRDGLPDAARQSFRAAATWEAWAFNALPTDRSRTRGIIAVSAVALYLRAPAYNEGIALARHYLTLGLPQEAVTQIRSLLRTLEQRQAGGEP